MLQTRTRNRTVGLVRIGEALEEFRQSGSEKARDRLAMAVQARLRKAIERANVPLAELDDVVQERTLPVLEALVGGAVTSSADAFVWQAGTNAAYDWHRRRRRGMAGRTVQLGKEALDRLVEESDESQDPAAERAREMLAAIHRVMDDARIPPAYRDVLHAHYVRDMSIEALAERELRENPRSKSGAPRTLQQARAAVDQRLSRARDWVRKRLLQQIEEEP